MTYESSYLSNLKEYLHDISCYKLELADALHKGKTFINWYETDYTTFKRFCALEVALPQSTIYKYVKVISCSNKFNFFHSERFLIVKQIGWERFAIGILSLKEPISVDMFIQKFKDLNLNEKPVPAEKESNLVDFSFSLDPETADILTAALVSRGMVINQNNVLMHLTQ